MSQPLIVLQLSDLHIVADTDGLLQGVKTEYSFAHLLNQAHTEHKKIDLVLITGDLAQHPCKKSYQLIYKLLRKYNIRTLCLPGNHDDLSLMNQYINDEQVNCKKHIKFKNWQVICLNSKKNSSQTGFLEKKELDFLAQTLTIQPDLKTLIAVHHHPISIKSTWMDGMMIENADQLFSLLSQYPQVKSIIFGHIHQEFCTQIHNIQLLGTPSTCFQFKPYCNNYTVDEQTPGYRLIKLYPDGVLQSKVYRSKYNTPEEI